MTLALTMALALGLSSAGLGYFVWELLRHEVSDDQKK